MGKEWYINGWGRDNMEYWAPARAGGQCSILYTTTFTVSVPALGRNAAAQQARGGPWHHNSWQLQLATAQW